MFHRSRRTPKELLGLALKEVSKNTDPTIVLPPPTVLVDNLVLPKPATPKDDPLPELHPEAKKYYQKKRKQLLAKKLSKKDRKRT